MSWPFSPFRERVLGGSWDPRPVYSWFLPLSREMSLPCKAVTPVLASRMPTSIARRHWGCSPSSNFSRTADGPLRDRLRFALGPSTRQGVGLRWLRSSRSSESPHLERGRRIWRCVLLSRRRNTERPSRTAGAPSQQQPRHEYPDLAEVALCPFGVRPFGPSTRIARLFSRCQGVVWGNLGAIFGVGRGITLTLALSHRGRGDRTGGDRAGMQAGRPAVIGGLTCWVHVFYHCVRGLTLCRAGRSLFLLDLGASRG